MAYRTKVVTGFEFTFTTPGDSPPRDYTPEHVWLIRESGNPVLGYAVVELGSKMTVVKYDYDAKTWSQITQWHRGLKSNEVAARALEVGR